MQDALDVQEAKSVHFECRVEPVNDPTLRIDWFFNGKPFATGSRVHVIFDFGFISLDMDYVYSRDSGEYICRATNKWGTAITKAKLTCTAKHNVILESQLPEGMSGEKLKALEEGPVQNKEIKDEVEAMPPRFLSQVIPLNPVKIKNSMYISRIALFCVIFIRITFILYCKLK